MADEPVFGVMRSEHFENAEDLLKNLDPMNDRWHTGPGQWAYRGQGQDWWKLVPSALRKKVGAPAEWEHPDLPDVRTKGGEPHTESRRRYGEAGLVFRFRDLADQVGLPIPEDSARLRSWRHLERIIGGSPFGAFGAGIPIDPKERWPQPEVFGLVALAQHYGIPTRLLDWSWKARVAAYFAARDVMKHGFTGRLAVWALNTGAINYMWAGSENDPDVEVVRAPQAPNPNLSAQAGLFTVARHVHEEVCLASVIDGKAQTTLFRGSVLIWKLTLPTSEARALMARLRLEGVHAGSVFPGFGGVADALEEQRWWQAEAVEQDGDE